MNTTLNFIDIEITLQGETRTVTFRQIAGTNKAQSGYIFGCRVGRGAKVHLTKGTAFLTESGWKFSEGSGYALNGQRFITNWAENVSEGAKSKHSGTAIA